MFKEKNFDALYSKLNDLGLTGHDIVKLMVNVYLIFKMAKVTILQLVTKQSILIFIQTYILIFGLNFSMKVFIFIVLCNRLHKSFDFFRKCD